MVGLYEDPELVRGWMMEEAMEEAMSVVPPGLEALLDTYVEAAVAAKPQKALKAGRPSVLGAAKAAVLKGEFPEPPLIGSATNLTYQKRLDTLRGMASVAVLTFGERIENIEAVEVKGKNTYARIVAGYRDLLLTYLKARQAENLNGLKVVEAVMDEDCPACEGYGGTPAGDPTNPAAMNPCEPCGKTGKKPVAAKKAPAKKKAA